LRGPRGHDVHGMDKRILKLCIAGRKKMEFVSDLMEVLNVEFQHDVKKFKIVHEN
jgi:hypothetical protein